MPAEGKQLWDEKVLCRFMGRLLLGIATAMAAIIVGAIRGRDWLSGAGTAAVVILAAFAVIYANTKGRLRKSFTAN